MKPIKFWMCGENHTLILNKKKNRGGGSVDKFVVTINNIEDPQRHWSDTLVHELIEQVYCQNLLVYTNYDSASKQELFFMLRHRDHEVVCMEVSGALRQILPQLPAKMLKGLTESK